VTSSSVRGDRVDPGRRALTVASDVLAATFRPDVGLVGTSLRYRDRELLVPPDLAARALSGLPLLAPWANRLGERRYAVAGVEVDLHDLPLGTDPNGLPIHGTMTWQPGWEVVRHEPAALTARFDFGARDDLLASFPFPHTLTTEVTVDGATLALATTVTATGDRPVPVSFGYHPYLRLPPAGREDLRLLLPRRRHLDLDARGLPTGGGRIEPAEDAPLGARTFDDLYALDDLDEPDEPDQPDEPDEGLMGLVGGGIRLTLRRDEGYPYAQVFAPPGHDFVCLEPMTAPVNALVDGTCPLVPPGGSYTARFSLRLDDHATR
jgi:aldose 1-epimerase